MKQEWTLEEIRDFNSKHYQSVSARIVKCLLVYYDELKSQSLSTETGQQGVEYWKQLAEAAEVLIHTGATHPSWKEKWDAWQQLKQKLPQRVIE